MNFYIVGVKHHLSQLAAATVVKEMKGVGVPLISALTVEGVGRFICCGPYGDLTKGFEDLERVSSYMEILFSQSFEVWICDLAQRQEFSKEQIIPLTKYHLSSMEEPRPEPAPPSFESEKVVHP